MGRAYSRTILPPPPRSKTLVPGPIGIVTEGEATIEKGVGAIASTAKAVQAVAEKNKNNATFFIVLPKKLSGLADGPLQSGTR